MKQYHFVTNWNVEAPIERVFEVILDSLAWPEWWHGVTHVEAVTPGDADGVGDVRRYTFRSVLPYALTFDVRSTLVDPPGRLFGDASGQLVGRGRWFLVPTAEGTSIRYEWDVSTTEWWMNLAGPIAGAVFSWNHDVIMRWGEQGLRARLGLPPREESDAGAGRLLRIAVAGSVAAAALTWLGLRRRRRS
ncbi:MAG: SRPBCC family protein [Chloroflexota bacterium]